MKFALSVLVFLLWAGAAMPRDVSIRSGEHDTFSRLVIRIGEGTQWSIQSTEAGAELWLSDSEAEFSTEGVLDRLPARRLDAVVDLGAGTLRIQTACAPCHVDSFLWRPGFLVVDIVDGPDPDRSADRELTQASPLRLPLSPEPADEGPIFLLPGAFEKRVGPERPRVAPDMVQFEGMAQELARAVAAGYLTPSVEGAIAQPTNKNAPEPMPEKASSSDDAGPVGAADPGNRRPGMTLGNALDRELAAVNERLASAVDETCLPQEAFEISDWVGEGSFANLIADLRVGLAAEFDRPSEAALLRLARGYLHFGFGREALATVSSLRPDRETALLAELARIVDDLPGDEPVLASQIGCQNGAAPWLLLSGNAALSDLDRNRVIRTFRLLPQPLQSHIGTGLARAFLDAGDVDGASLVFESVRGRDAARTAEAQRLEAGLLEANGDSGGALGILDPVAGDRPDPGSLIRLIELSIQTGDRPSDSDMVLAAALMQEYRETDAEPALAATMLRGHIARSEWRKGREILTDFSDRWDDDQYRELADDLYRKLVSSGQTPIFLRLGFEALPKSLSADTVNAVAARLIENGFAERALELVRRPAEGEAMGERRYLRAEAALKLGQTQDAIQHLGGMTDARAEQLRADAMFAMGDYRGALAARPDSPDPAADFRAGAWDRLAVSGDPILREVAEKALSQPDMTEMQDLAERRAALEGARETRRTIAELLERFPVESADADSPGN